MLRTFYTAFFSMIFCIFAATPAITQNESRAILVLDASGSMWGQIEGVAKITIAQHVVGDLLATLPQSQLLGLTAYGHRRKGDCSDIETLHLPGVDRALIAASVNALSPRGKTPLSAAVLQAAEALKYTENAATVILISDGIETCNLDPCAIGRQLEETGVDFTAHVIGFDVTDPVAQAQLQCLAHKTGGMYLPADNAGELADALQEMAQAPAPIGIPVTVSFRAIEGEGGPVIDTDLVWTMGTDNEGILYENEVAGQISHMLMGGDGEVQVMRITDEASASTRFTIADRTIAGGNMLITLILPKLIANATLLAADTAIAGSLIPVTWTGPAGEHDYITSAELGMADVVYVEYVKTRDSEGDVAILRMPPKAGLYEIRYIENTSREVLARRNIQVTPLTIELDAPAQAAAGATIQVGWVGPDYGGDFLSVAKIGTNGQLYENYVNLGDGTPASLLMPAEPGIYEIRYVLNASRTIAGSVTIEVVEVFATLEAPETASAGSSITVDWAGPAYERDYITIAKAGDGPGNYESYTYTRDGNPLSLQMPTQPGEYELRYILNGTKDVILARIPITIEAVTARIKAPDTAPAGSKLVLNWQGPGGDRDYITIAKASDGPGNYESYTYTRDGNPLSLQMPTQPGEYELRYILQGSELAILMRSPITITAVSATLDAPDSAIAGSEIIITWTGPEGDKDHLTVAMPSDNPSQYESFVYVRDGNPLSLRVPTKPGTYEVRYIIQGTDRSVLQRQILVVE